MADTTHPLLDVDARSLSPQVVADALAPVFVRWGVERAWLYGSLARGDQRAHSDADIAIELLPTRHMGLSVVSFEAELEDALGVSVDVQLVPDPQRANPAFVHTYERDKVLIYECETG